MKIKAIAAAFAVLVSAACGDAIKKENTPSEPEEEQLKEYTSEEVRDALVRIYNATKGALWTKSKGWCTDADISTWQGITCDGDGCVTAINLASNNLDGTLPDVFDRFPRLKTLRLDDNEIRGQVPHTLALLKTDGFSANLAYNRFSTTTLKVPDYRIETVSAALKVHPCNNEAFQLFVDSNRDGLGTFHKDGEVKVIHKAEGCDGFDLVFIGDGFDRDENTVGGTLDHWLDVAVEAHFKIHPYPALYKYFNIYFIYNYSPAKGVSLRSSSVNSRFHYTQPSYDSPHVGFDYSACRNFIKTALKRDLKEYGTVVVIPNVTQNAIWGGVEMRRDTRAYCFCPPRATSFRQLVQHESGGHGVGRVIDEYTGNLVLEEGDDPSADKVNADIEKDPTKVKWARFIADERYKDEDLGVFEGCLKYKKGVYRPSYRSVLNSGSLRNEYYNVPSRANIYKSVLECALGSSFKFDYETFVQWDLANR